MRTCFRIIHGFSVRRVTFPLVYRVEHQTLNQTTADLLCLDFWCTTWPLTGGSAAVFAHLKEIWWRTALFVKVFANLKNWR